MTGKELSLVFGTIISRRIITSMSKDIRNLSGEDISTIISLHNVFQRCFENKTDEVADSESLLDAGHENTEYLYRRGLEEHHILAIKEMARSSHNLEKGAIELEREQINLLIEANLKHGS